MNILILGGTQFVGRHIVEELLFGGHWVTIFNRGITQDDLPATVERLRGDRNDGPAALAPLAGRNWDVCIDVSGCAPRHVKASTEMLASRIPHYIFISAVAVYGDPVTGPVTETHALIPAVDEDVALTSSNAVYGGAKVACEKLVQENYGARCTILRSQIIAGPHDLRNRLTYWVQRAMQSGDMLAPGDGSDFVQFIAARDLARFTKKLVENSIYGIFNIAGARITWQRFIEGLNAQNVVWVPSQIINSAGLTENELPLYRKKDGPRSRLMHVSNASAVSAGLRLSELEETVSEMRHWLAGQNLFTGLSPSEEAALIQRARQG